MSTPINYENNPLNGLSLKNMVTELVDHYGYEILFAYLNINCFNINPSIESSVKFLKKTEWAREKVELFYMYQYKSLPRVSSEQFNTPPRDRIVSDDEKPGEPAVLSLEDAERMREKQSKKAAEFSQNGGRHGRSSKKFGGEGHTRRASHYSGNNNSSKNNSSKYKANEKPHSSSLYNDASQTPSTENSNDNESNDSDPWAKWRK